MRLQEMHRILKTGAIHKFAVNSNISVHQSLSREKLLIELEEWAKCSMTFKAEKLTA